MTETYPILRKETEGRLKFNVDARIKLGDENALTWLIGKRFRGVAADAGDVETIYADSSGLPIHADLCETDPYDFALLKVLYPYWVEQRVGEPAFSDLEAEITGVSIRRTSITGSNESSDISYVGDTAVILHFATSSLMLELASLAMPVVNATWIKSTSDISARDYGISIFESQNYDCNHVIRTLQPVLDRQEAILGQFELDCLQSVIGDKFLFVGGRGMPHWLMSWTVVVAAERYKIHIFGDIFLSLDEDFDPASTLRAEFAAGDAISGENFERYSDHGGEEIKTVHVVREVWRRFDHGTLVWTSISDIAIVFGLETCDLVVSKAGQHDEMLKVSIFDRFDQKFLPELDTWMEDEGPSRYERSRSTYEVIKWA
jgi:hypothetical protein